MSNDKKEENGYDLVPSQNTETDPYTLFLYWRTRPLSEHKIKTVEEFCEHFSITKEQIKEFQRRPTFTEDLQKETVNWFKKQAPKVLHILIQKIEQAQNTNDIKKYAEIFDIFTKEKDKGNTNTFNIINISQDKFKKIAQREAKLISQDESYKL